jgi:hypothetical protein
MGSPPQYSPALRWVTTGFGMGPGGASTLSATGTPHPHREARRPSCASPAGGRPALLSAHPRALSRNTPHAHPRRSRGAGHGQDEGIPLPLARAAPRSGPDAGSAGDSDLRPRPLGRLGSSRLPAVHLPPINPVICRGSYLVMSGDARLGEGFPLRCFQRFARPHVATQRCRSRDNWHTSGASTPVLSY